MTPEQIINSVLDDLEADSTGATVIAALNAAGYKIIAQDAEEIIDRECAVAFRDGHCADAHAIIAALNAAGYKIMPRVPRKGA
jgi:predicted CoA-binding protein